MSNNEQPINKILLTPRFKQDLRKLAKRYPLIRQDIIPLVEQLQRGETPGNRISGNKYQVIKVRLKKRCDPASPKGARERASRIATSRKEKAQAIELYII